METYRVKFVHPTTGASFEADIDPSLTADETISGLLSEGFIEPAKAGQHYALGVNGGEKFSGSRTLAESGVKDGDTVNMRLDGVAG